MLPPPIYLAMVMYKMVAIISFAQDYERPQTATMCVLDLGEFDVPAI